MFLSINCIKLCLSFILSCCQVVFSHIRTLPTVEIPVIQPNVCSVVCLKWRCMILDSSLLDLCQDH